MLVEIDTRTIPGIGQVCWEIEDGGHVVTVIDADGRVRARLAATDGATARELFRHPFAGPGVPDLFTPAPEPAAA